MHAALALMFLQTLASAAAVADPLPSSADGAKVRTFTIRPQSSEERRDASRHSQLPVTLNPDIDVAPSPDRYVVPTIRVPSRSPQQ